MGDVSGVLQVAGDEHVMLISNSGKVIRIKVADIPVNHRATGVKLIDSEPEEKLVGIARTTAESASEMKKVAKMATMARKIMVRNK